MIAQLDLRQDQTGGLSLRIALLKCSRTNGQIRIEARFCKDVLCGGTYHGLEL